MWGRWTERKPPLPKDSRTVEGHVGGPGSNGATPPVRRLVTGSACSVYPKAARAGFHPAGRPFWLASSVPVRASPSAPSRRNGDRMSCPGGAARRPVAPRDPESRQESPDRAFAIAYLKRGKVFAFQRRCRPGGPKRRLISNRSQRGPHVLPESEHPTHPF